jgi:hypothetical protein
LAENEIIATQVGDHQCRPTFSRPEIGLRER